MRASPARDAAAGPQIIEIELGPGAGALERILSVLRVRGEGFTRLEYQAGGQDRSDIVTVFLEEPTEKSGRIPAYLRRIVAVRTVAARDIGVE